MIWTLFIYRRWGALVPILATLSFVAARIVADALALPWNQHAAVVLAGGGLLTGLALWLADRHIQSVSGYVYYDPETDQPVVEEECSGSWLFITLRGWMMVIPLLTVPLGAAMLFAPGEGWGAP